jgi:heat shock protein HslJ/uncharacterized membrane protein
MNARTLLIAIAAPLVLAACQRSETPEPAPAAAPAARAPAAQPEPAAAAPSFVNRVWSVAESKQVEEGALRVFLSDGTLVMASPDSKPAFGQWRSEGGRLTITEEGRSYPTDILALRDDAFRIRMHSPGEPVEMLLAPAEQPPIETVASAPPAGVEPAARAQPPASDAEPAAPAAAAAVALLGSAWRLQDPGNGKLVAGTQPTLEFPTEGRAGGNGSCNRFNGIVIVAGDGIKFSGLATTRKACPEPVMRQEDAYLAALRDAVRFESNGESLRIHSAGREAPLVFTAAPEGAAAPAQGIQAAPVTEAPSLMGIWTVVGHSTPGVGAMSDEQAKAIRGQGLRLLRNAAVSGGERCDAPRYAARTEPAEEFLAAEYQLAPGSLAPVARRSRIQVMRVSCSGSPWAALGGTLIEVDRDRALAPWNGVFFEVVRGRDFRAVGQEPGWQLEIRMGSEMRFTYDYGKGSAVTPAARAQLDAKTGTRTFHATTGSDDLRVEIVPVACEDSMSGRAFAATVTVTLNGRTFRGCGESLSTPYQG